MVYSKAWRDLRGRFLLCVFVVSVAVLPQTIISAVRGGQDVARSPEEEAAWSEGGSGRIVIPDFQTEVQRWFEGREALLVVLAVVLAVGGTMTEANTRTNLLILSLPRSRRRWLQGQAIVVMGMVLALAAWVAVLMAGVGLAFGEPIPWNILAPGIVTVTLGASIWIGPALLGTAMTRESVKAGIVVFTLVLLAAIMDQSAVLKPWYPYRVGRLSVWSDGIPWRALAVALTMAFGGYLGAVRRFERADY